jgi:rod shape-determining protein MreD
VRALISFVVVSIAVVFQLTVVDRIAFPGGSGPDLVLLAVAALALASGPMTGALTGFWAGLALDVAPPGSHFVGQNALVFCLIGYGCGLLADDSSGDGATEPGHTALFEIVVTAAGAILGEALSALLGVMLSDPRVTWSAITNVLPVAVAYDVLLCPFVLYAAAAALRLAGVLHPGGARAEGQRAGWSAARAPGAGTGGLGAVREIGGGSTPRLRLSERGRGGKGVRAHGPVGGRPLAPRREPQLKLGRSGPAARPSSLTSGLGAALAAGGLGGGQARVRFGSRRGEGVLGGSMLGSARPGRSALRSSGFASSSMGRSWLGGSVFSRSSSSLGSPSRGSSSLGLSSPLARPVSFGRSSGQGLRRQRTLMRSPGAGLGGGHAPHFSRGGPFARLTGVLRRQRSLSGGTMGRGAFARAGRSRAGRSRTGLGGTGLGGTSRTRTGLGHSALGRSAFKRTGLGRGWTGTSRLRSVGTGRIRGVGGSGPARLHMPRPKAKRRWRKGGYR